MWFANCTCVFLSLGPYAQSGLWPFMTTITPNAKCPVLSFFCKTYLGSGKLWIEKIHSPILRVKNIGRMLLHILLKAIPNSLPGHLERDLYGRIGWTIRSLHVKVGTPKLNFNQVTGTLNLRGLWTATVPSGSDTKASITTNPPLLRQPTQQKLWATYAHAIWSLEKNGGKAWFAGREAVREAPLSEAVRNNPMASKYPPTLSQL